MGLFIAGSQMFRRLSVIVLLSLLAVASAQEVIPHHQDAPPGPALSPAEAIKKMTVHEGFSVELVASEPDIVNPVAMAFDERGRIWITESLEYPRKQPGPGKDRVKILEDTDGDGKADKFSIFAEGLNIPSGIAVGHGGVWVANSPDILFYPDADRDGKADGPAQVVVTGFGRTDTHELPNSLTWGPDGYLYGLNGVFNFSHVKYGKENPNYKEDHPGWQFTCACFRIHPVTREFEIFCEGTSNPWGLAFDHEGSAFVSACVIDHLWHLVRTGYYHRQGGPYPPFTWKIESIVKHKHQKAAYCGLEYYDSDAYPEQYRNKLYMGNIHGGCINVDKLQRDGSTYFATGEPDFLTANDAWFMPVSQKTGPDGCMYILDWYDRYHCYQDANRDSPGLDRLKGRLYRVRYKDTPRAKAVDLAKETDEQLFGRLASDNGYSRDIAQRLLIERRTHRNFHLPDNIALAAEKLISDEKLPLRTRMNAVSVAVSLSDAPDEVLVAMVKSSSSTIRAWSVRATNLHRSNVTDPPILEQLADDPSPDVKLQVAIAVATTAEYRKKMSVLMKVLASSGTDKLIPHVVWQNLHPLLADRPDELVDNSGLFRSPSATSILPRVIDRVLARNKSPDVAIVARLFEPIKQGETPVAEECVALLTTRVQSGELSNDYLAELREKLRWDVRWLTDPDSSLKMKLDVAILQASWGDYLSLNRAELIFADKHLDASTRAKALSALIAASKISSTPTKKHILELAGPVLSKSDGNGELADQVLSILGKLDDAGVALAVLGSYASLPKSTQPRALELLTQRAIWAKPLIAAIGENKIPATALNVNQIQRLLALKDAELTAAVNKHWGTIRTTRDPAREQFVGEMRKLVRSTKGDPHKGIEVFNRVCGQCHKIHGQGQDVGPDITSNGRASFEQLLSNVFDPSLVIGAIYQARTVQAADGRIVTGLLVEDSPQRIVLKVQGGKLETIAREDVDAMKVSELSLMPEGLEKQLKPQEIADLFAFITLDKHPSDPTAKPIPSGADGKK
jgi:putative membrane-bound dehydrogenase-like protein